MIKRNRAAGKVVADPHPAKVMQPGRHRLDETADSGPAVAAQRIFQSPARKIRL